MLVVIKGATSAFTSASTSNGAAGSTCVSAWRDVSAAIVRDGSLAAVAAPAADDACAVGKDGANDEPLVEHRDGASWTAEDLPFRSAALVAVASVTRDDVWAVGQKRIAGNQSGVITHWDGGRWELVTTPRLPPLAGIAVTAGDDVWTVGGATIAHWDNHQWTVARPVGAATMSAVAAISRDDVWAVGSTARERALAVHWDGAGWTSFRLSDAAHRGFLGTVAATSGSDVWVGGNNGDLDDDYGKPLLLHSDGSRWSGVANRWHEPFPTELVAVSAVRRPAL
jgi:hypothetical protein